MLSIKRVYETPEAADGARYLVERLWPRGIKKENLPMQAWLKDAAPSPELRKWFAHDPAKWPEFQHRYRAELDSHPRPSVRARPSSPARVPWRSPPLSRNRCGD